MKKIFKICLFMTAPAVLLNCAETGNLSVAGSCYNAQGYCIEYPGINYTAASVQSSCTGTYSTQPCPASDFSGTCYGHCFAFKGSQIFEQKIIFYPSYIRSAADFACFLYLDSVHPGGCP